jgi:hypothetical protein
MSNRNPQIPQQLQDAVDDVFGPVMAIRKMLVGKKPEEVYEEIIALLMSKGYTRQDASGYFFMAEASLHGN